MKKYSVISRLDYDQKRYEPGASVELDDDEADPLLALGVIARAEKSKDDKPKDDKQKS